jgi:hypothetical protein
MGRRREKAERHDESKLRIIWDRWDTYDAVAAVVRGRRVGPLRVAFFDREKGILPTVPAIIEGHAVDAWPRSRKADNLAAMSFSIEPDDRRAGLAIVSTRFGGTWIDPAKPCFVYFLTDPESSDHLPKAVPLGGFVSSVGQANWAVAWTQLQTAASVADLRAGGEEE